MVWVKVTGVTRILFGGHLADATLSCISRDTFEAVAGSWGSVSAPAINGVRVEPQSEIKIANKYR